MPDIFQTSLTGLRAFQSSIATTSHNISNVNTEGYSRQRVDLAANPPSRLGNGFFGNGVEITSVNRLYDMFLTREVQVATSGQARQQQFYDLASQLGNIVADPYASVNVGLSDFFAAVQDVANNPADTAPRQVMISEAQNLVNRFHTMDDRLRRLTDETEKRIQTDVGDLNAIAQQIASINGDIVSLGNPAGAEPNDLLDRRNVLLEKLSELVSIDVVDNSDGSINVFIGSGQALVLGQQASSVTTAQSAFNPERSEIVYQTPNGPLEITSQITGGKLGALLDARSTLIEPAQNQLGRIAITMALEFNDQHQKGMDLNGLVPANAFFDVTSVDVKNHQNNLGSGSVIVDYDLASIGNLTTSDYEVRFDAGQWQITRLSDGQTTTSAPGSVVVDGLNFNLGGAPTTGDRFLIRPTAFGARDMDVLIDRPNEIAAASPVRSLSNVNNLGDGDISKPLVVDFNHPNLLDTISFTYADTDANPATREFTIATSNATPLTAADIELYDQAGNLIGNPVVTSAGPPEVYEIPADSVVRINGWQVEINATKNFVGDNFRVELNSGAVSDNTNMLLLSQMENQPILENGTDSFSESYSSLTGFVGNLSRQSEINMQAQDALLTQARASRDSVSGVNLDEEAANLLKFQQAYQAMARVINTADSLFQSILQAVS